MMIYQSIILCQLQKTMSRLDDDNLITVCGYHHEMAESGQIDRQALHEIAKEQNEKREMQG